MTHAAAHTETATAVTHKPTYKRFLVHKPGDAAGTERLTTMSLCWEDYARMKHLAGDKAPLLWMLARRVSRETVRNPRLPWSAQLRIEMLKRLRGGYRPNAAALEQHRIEEHAALANNREWDRALSHSGARG